MHWPRVIKGKGSHQGDSLKQAGRLTNQVGHIVDISTTLREITGADYPKEILGRKTKKPVGLSLLPIFEGKQRAEHKEIYWRFNRANAVRQGNMKAIRAGKSWELYDLQADPTETRNLAKLQPEKVNELADKWELWNADALGKKETE